MAKGKSRDEVKEAYWQGKLHEQSRSGLRVREFCRGQKLAEGSFYFWRREIARRQCEHKAKPGRRQELKRRDQPRGDRAVRSAVQSRGHELFVPVRVRAEEPCGRGGEIAIVLSGGSRIHLTPPVDRQSLRDILAAMEGRPC